MLTSTLTSSGQTTTPKFVRETFGLWAGDRVEFPLEDDPAVLRRAGADITARDGSLDRAEQNSVRMGAVHDAIARALVAKRSGGHPMSG